MMFRTDALRLAGGYKFADAGEDWDMMLRLAEIRRLANLDEVLYMWRIHPLSVTAQQAGHCQRRIHFACHLAHRRAMGCPEVSYETFLREESSVMGSIRRALEHYAFVQYRRGLYDWLTARRLAGSLRLGWAAMFSNSSGPLASAIRVARRQRQND